MKPYHELHNVEVFSIEMKDGRIQGGGDSTNSSDGFIAEADAKSDVVRIELQKLCWFVAAYLRH